jgi:hypothetical protein
MKDVTIRNRADGVTELSPKLAALAPEDRFLVIVTVVLVTGGFFISGLIPAAVAGAVTVSCVAGEVFLGAKALVLALLRPLAEVHEVAHVAAYRRRGH